MKTQFFKIGLPLFVVALAGMLFATACTKEENENPPAGNTDSDFMLVKNSVGKTFAEAESIALGKGYVKSTEENWLYTINENGNTKRLLLYTNTSDSEEILKNVEMTVHTTDLNILKMYFKKWVGQLQQNLDLTTVTHKEYVIEYDEDNDREYSTIDALLSDINRLTAIDEDFSAEVGCVDQQSFTYEITLYSDLVSLQIINDRVDAGNDTIPFSDEIVGKDRDMLLMRVDYLTYNYLGYTTLTVNDKIPTGDTIPFFSDYFYPEMDYGYIKLYYGNNSASNMLFYGEIIRMGCGQMQFPNGFVRSRTNYLEMPYPGQQKICMFDSPTPYAPPRYINVSDETTLQNIWNTISIQSEFQYFYSRTTKKVAVYLYTPSVGCGNPADWYYLVFVEQQ